MSETNGKHGRELDAALDHLPALMAELTKEFIEKKDLNARVQIRCRMRALLDLAFVDTIWPTNAMKKPDSTTPARDMAMNDGGFAGGQLTVPPGMYTSAVVQPVPGAGRADDNTI